MNVKTLIPLVAVYLAVCHAAAGSRGSRGSLPALSVQASPFRSAVERLSESCEGVAEGFTELGEFASRQDPSIEDIATLLSDFSRVVRNLTNRKIDRSYLAMAKVLGNARERKIENTAALIEESDDNLSLIKGGAEKYLEALRRWKSQSESLAGLFEKRAEDALRRELIELNSFWSEMCKMCNDVTLYASSKTVIMERVVRILADKEQLASWKSSSKAMADSGAGKKAPAEKREAAPNFGGELGTNQLFLRRRERSEMGGGDARTKPSAGDAITRVTPGAEAEKESSGPRKLLRRPRGDGSIGDAEARRILKELGQSMSSMKPSGGGFLGKHLGGQDDFLQKLQRDIRIIRESRATESKRPLREYVEIEEPIEGPLIVGQSLFSAKSQDILGVGQGTSSTKRREYDEIDEPDERNFTTSQPPSSAEKQGSVEVDEGISSTTRPEYEEIDNPAEQAFLNEEEGSNCSSSTFEDSGWGTSEDESPSIASQSLPSANSQDVLGVGKGTSSTKRQDYEEIDEPEEISFLPNQLLSSAERQGITEEDEDPEMSLDSSSLSEDSGWGTSEDEHV